MGKIQLANKRVYVLFMENPISGDDIPRIKVPRDFILQEITALKLDAAAGSVDFELRTDPDASQTGAGTLIHSDTGVTNNTTGVVYVAGVDFAAFTVPANNFIWMELANVTTGLNRPVSFSLELVGVEQGP